MGSVVVTQHACARYVERVNPRLTPAEARAAIHAHDPMIEKVAEFAAGADATVILGNGAKLLLDGRTVVTVYQRGWIRHDRKGVGL